MVRSSALPQESASSFSDAHISEEVEKTIKQSLAFRLGNEHYGIDILHVAELRGWEKTARIPNAPEYVKGVINLRGIIVPIYDLRVHFDVGEVKYDSTTVVIVLSNKNPKAERMIGCVVDAVTDVLSIDEDEIVALPPFGGTVAQQYAVGLASLECCVVTILGVDQMLSIGDSADEKGESND